MDPIVPGIFQCDHNMPLVATNNQASSERDKPAYVNSLQASYFSVSQLPKLCMKADEISITTKGRIPGGLASCQKYFTAVLSYPIKGRRTQVAHEFQLKLDGIWKLNGSWSIVPLGRGYFEFSFCNDEDLKTILATSPWQ